ncbi:hypothetical protein [Desulfolutivibrio sp.]|uniref:hypothetical protein n=1 Tax=Desulfolutivibrio sp. TaxID=2773296 RepID=UPI002F964235
MDESRLNIPECLRAWHFAGIRHFFIEKKEKSNFSLQDQPSTWKAPWCEFFSKVPPTAFLFFTYYDLGKDLAGLGNSDRRTFWRRFIPFFHLPKGSIAFWPLAIFSQSTYQVQISDFFKTIAFFTPSLVACFGDDCEQSIKQTLPLQNIPRPKLLFFPHIELLFQSTDHELSLISKQILSQLMSR